MKFSDFWNDLKQKQSGLIFSGVGFAALFLILTIFMLFDSEQILGINRWIKPMKFAGSVSIFLLTLAVYLYFLPGLRTSKALIAWGTIAMQVEEIVLIVMQAARGTTSHFNFNTLFDAAVFGAMGLMILLNSLLIIYLTFLYFRTEINLPTAIVWGLRLGLIVFLFGSIEGGYMSSQARHAVGAADGGAGLPFVNWSAENGDLRVAHFVGLHALQMIPLAALLLYRWRKRSATILTFAFALVYLSSFTFVFVQAMHGKPLLSIERIKSNNK